MTKSVTMRPVNRRGFGALAAGVASFAIIRPSHAQTVLKWAYVYEPTEPHHKGAVTAAAEIEKRTNGRYKIQLFPSATLGRESDLNQGLTLGTVDMIISAASFQAQVARRIGVAYFPFIFRDYDHVQKYGKSDVYGAFADDYQRASGNRIVAITYAAERQVTSNRPILKPEDMKGLKIRVPDAAAYMAFPKALGANPTPIALAEVYLALQSGVVDAQENAFNTIWARKFHEVQKHISLTGHVIDSLNTVIGGQLWNRLSAADKAIFAECMQLGALQASQEIRDQDTVLMGEIKKLGTSEIHSVDKVAFRQAVLASSKPEDFGYQRADYDKIIALT
jgi:tripartite ATP-independent transporter DctP family solute receptor